MDFTLGLDFGTHQSKLCLSYMPNNEQIYEFLEFVKPDGTTTFLFPSIIQLNKDETISVGFVDKENCMCRVIPMPQEPIYPEKPSDELPQQPKKIYPEKPKKEKTDWKDQLLSFSKGRSKDQELLAKWEQQCREIDKKWEVENYKWLEIRERFEEEHNNWQTLVDNMRRDYESKVSAWKSSKPQLQYYRYFKLASFSNSYPWDKDNLVNADTLTVWYLTYLLLLVKKTISNKFHENFEECVSIQMGIPSGLKTTLSKQIENHAYQLLISARNLMDSFHSPEDFCSYKYQTLLEMTKIPTSDIKATAESYGFVVIQEAYAGLKSLTHRKRLIQGQMHILVDIGGGTTDIAFFTINNDLEPNILCVKSFHHGLNFVFDNFCKENNSYSISDAQEYFMIDQKPFYNGIKAYTKELSSQLSNMIEHVISEFNKEAGPKGFFTESLIDAMKGRPIVYCGGGSMYKNMKIQNEYFNDIKTVDKNLMNIPNLSNTNIDDSLFTILATSYGLSIAMIGGIELMDISTLFNKMPQHVTTQARPATEYEHGMTDL